MARGIRAKTADTQALDAGETPGLKGNLKLLTDLKGILRGGRERINPEVARVIAGLCGLIARQARRISGLEKERDELNEQLAEMARRLNRAAEIEADLSIQATRDPLTGLMNRRALDGAWNTILESCREKGNTMALALFDIDHFKNVNDSHGHAIGDMVLQTFSKLLDDLRPTDFSFRVGAVARDGGEEFVVLFADTDLAGAMIAAERVRTRLESEVFEYDHPEKGHIKFCVTVSGGIEEVGPEDSQLGEVKDRADKALYGAKKAGRNRMFSSGDLKISSL